MKKHSLFVYLLSVCFAGAAFASQSVITLKDAQGNSSTTNKTPKILAVEQDSTDSESYLFVFYRDEQKNDKGNNDQFIVYQYAKMMQGANALPVWSNPIRIPTDVFDSKQNVAAAYANGRIYLLGKRDGVRYTSATLQQAINNQWQSWEYLRDNQGSRIESHEDVDAVAHEVLGVEGITVAYHYKRDDAGSNKIVALLECAANGVTLSCGEKSQASGNELSKQYWTDNRPTVAFAPDVADMAHQTLYVMWPSHERMEDQASVDEFLYYRRLSSANARDYYGDYREDGITRPKDFVKSKNSLHAIPAIAALEHNGALELFRQTSEGSSVTRFRYNVGGDSAKNTLMTELATLPIKAKSSVTAASLNGALYVVYQNADKNVGGNNSVNLVVVE